ncbi:MafI family immunity protein [Streptomyces cacaoi]|uniref:MafI family immunity protein n=1 Tax=Streptomyces cacaoi TaxID=1898 RepID=UPI0011F3CE65|nr:MafI family immunity protein [Streptomyces cacaoi]
MTGEETPRSWLRTRSADVINDSPIPAESKSELLEDVEAGEYAIAVEFLCSQLYEHDHKVTRRYFDALASLYEDLSVGGHHLALVEQNCLLPDHTSAD